MAPAGMELPPLAPLLMQSLRAVGYSTASALADLVDNSIAAAASDVQILVRLRPDRVIAVLDDGRGMDEVALVAAMRFGSRDPREPREGLDLGRFGLGLKTASLSQCRRLTVISLRAGGDAVAAAWDLDECHRRQGWWLSRPAGSELDSEIVGRLTDQGHGTAVIWSDLDRILATGGPDADRAVEVAVEEAADQLALTFHRFLAGEFTPGFRIKVNGRPLPRRDPFLEGHARGQALHPETFPVDGHEVTVSPFVLPFPSRLGQSDLDAAGGRDSLKSAHGFYIYRGGRLIVPGGWFRIVPADELLRLARVRVDVPVALDHLWKTDIRKAAAEPPAALRQHLRRIVGDVTLRSRRVYSHRGTPTADTGRVALWRRIDGRDGAASWVVNREHPIVAATLAGAGSDTEDLLRLIEAALPAHDIHLHLTGDHPLTDPDVPSPEQLRALARRILAAFADRPDMARAILASLPATDPFSRAPDVARSIVQELAA